MTPVFRIVRGRSDDESSHYLGRAVRSIVHAWAKQGPAFVEIEEMPDLDSNDYLNTHPAALVHTALRAASVESVPVLHIHAPPEVQQALFGIARRYNTGIAFRIYPDDLDDQFHTVGRLTELLELSSVAEAASNVLIDLGYIRADALGLLRDQVLRFVCHLSANIPDAQLAIIGSCIPPTLKRLPKNGICEMLKFEEQLWRYVSRNSRVNLAFGDHCVVCADYVDQVGPFPHINAKLYYSVPGSMVVCRGQSKAKERLESQVSRLAKMLVASNYFYGHTFSWGDSQLWRIANGAAVQGMPSKIIEICASHHLTERAHALATEPLLYP
jgi:hypothetical protein